MKKILVINSLFLAFSLILSACANAAPTQDPGQVATRVAKAMATLIATQKAQPTTTPIIPTVGSLPTLAPVNLPTVSLPGVPTSVPCNLPPLSLSETFPDGTAININTAFNKSWTIQNASSCTWNANYKIRFVSGDSMSGPSFALFGANVPPGGTITLNLPLKTPGAAGTTTGYWGLYDDKDVWFGRVWVTINSITISPTSASFEVTTVTIAKVTGCKFTALITANGAGTVTYTWNYTDAGVPLSKAPIALTFSGATTLTVDSPDLPGTTTVVSIYILPNRLEWPYSAAPIPVPCG